MNGHADAPDHPPGSLQLSAPEQGRADLTPPGPPAPLPALAHDLARLLSDGNPLSVACSELAIPEREALELTRHPDWPKVFRLCLPKRDEVEDRLDALMRPSIAVHQEILGDPEASKALRFKVAASLLDRRGYKAADRKEVLHYHVDAPRRALAKATIEEMEVVVDAPDE